MSDQTVVVSESVQPVHALDEQGSDVYIGDVISRVYEGENVQRHSYRPKTAAEQVVTNKKGFRSDREYRLGPTTTSFRFVDHARAVQPLLEEGYRLKKQVIGRGGLSLHAILEPEQAHMIADPIHWDSALWTPSGNDTINESIIVTTSVKPGKAITYRRGWFRLICTNGLVAEILNLGSIRFNHANWDEVKLLHHLDLERGKMSGLDAVTAMGPVVGTVAGIRRMADLLLSLAPAAPKVEDEDDDDDEEAEAAPLPADQLPFFARKALDPFRRQPSWYIESLAKQFEAMANGYSQGNHDVHALDIVNAVTSPVNLQQRDHPDTAAFRPLNRTRSLIDASTQLVGAFSLI